MGARAREAEVLLCTRGGGRFSEPRTAPPSDWVMGGGGRSDSRLGLGPRGRWSRPAWGFGATGPSGVCWGGRPQLLSKLLCDLGPVLCPLWACVLGKEWGHECRRGWHRHPFSKRRRLGVMNVCPLAQCGCPPPHTGLLGSKDWRGRLGGGADACPGFIPVLPGRHWDRLGSLWGFMAQR